MTRSAPALSVACLAAALVGWLLVEAAETAPPKPLRVLLVAGGCCHDYATQTMLLQAGIQVRLHAEVEIEYNPDNDGFLLAKRRGRCETGAMQETETTLGPVSWQRMSEGIEKVKDRLRRAAAALDSAGIPYAVIGGNAVAAWVSRIDDSVVRNTRDVDLLVRREDLPQIARALEAVGFVHRSASILGGRGRIEMFLDGPGAKARDAVHLIFAEEKVNPEAPEASPSVDRVDPGTSEFRLLDLEALVTMKLTSYRDKDRVHLRDMLEIGQIDASWVERVPPSLRERLQALIDDPDG